MFERFTESARRVVVLAHEEVVILRHDHLGTEHILLGLLRQDEGLGARALESLEVTVERARREVVRTIGTGEKAMDGQIPFTPDALRALEGALREADSLGHDFIDTEHVLLGLLTSQGAGARVLDALGVTADAVRDRLIAMLGGRP